MLSSTWTYSTVDVWIKSGDEWTEKSNSLTVIVLCKEFCHRSQICGAKGDGLMALTVSLSPGTERLLRLRASSLGSEPGADRSISERLWSGAREREMGRRGGGGVVSKMLFEGRDRLEGKHRGKEADNAKHCRNKSSSPCYPSDNVWTFCCI